MEVVERQLISECVGFISEQLDVENIIELSAAIIHDDSIIQLQESGKPDINKPLKNNFPKFNPKTKNIDINLVTPKSVITYCSGIQTDVFKNADSSLKNILI